MVNQINKKGEVAMGTLIIFIAMILIAAVAAAVLISSIGSIQSKALETGSATKQEIGTNLNVVEIYAEKQVNVTALNNFSIIIKLSAGSDPVKLEDVLLSIGTDSIADSFTYNDTAKTATQFTVEYLLEGANHVDDYLVKGDVARILVDTSANVAEDKSLRIGFIPKIGTPTVVFATTPTTIASSRETIFP